MTIQQKGQIDVCGYNCTFTVHCWKGTESIGLIAVMLSARAPKISRSWTVRHEVEWLGTEELTFSAWKQAGGLEETWRSLENERAEIQKAT